jgi:SAM-dependent methyltransferase
MLKTLIIIIFLVPPAWLIYTIAVYLRTRVNYLATPKKYLPEILKELEINEESVIYDLGCGQGDFLFAVEKYGPKELVGFELSPWHAFYGWLKAKILKSKVKIYCRDFFKADIAKVDLFYLFLSEPVISKIWQKIKKEGKKGAWAVALSNTIAGVAYQKETKIKSGVSKNTRLYFYQI